MKVALVLDTNLDSDAGVQQYFRGLANFLISKDHDVRFIVPPSNKNINIEFKKRIISFGKNISLKCNSNTVQTVLYFGQKIKKVLEKEKFDIIHISAPFGPFIGAKVIKYANCPIVSSYMVYSKDEIFTNIAGKVNFLYKGFLKKIKGFIAVSEAAKEEAEKVIPGDYKVIPIGVDLNKFSPTNKKLSKFCDGKLNILYLGRLEKRKGTIYLLKAYKFVKEKFKNVRLIIVGSGPEQKNLLRFVNKNKLQDVIFEGYVSEVSKPRYYASADLCVFPAIYGECFGVVLIEAMASGKPIVAYSNCGYKSVLGCIPELLVEPKDVIGLSEKILNFLKDSKLRKKFGKRCLIESKKYAWDRVGAQVLNVYKEIIKVQKS